MTSKGFTQNRHPRVGVVMSNVRNLSYGFLAGSLALPFLSLEPLGLVMGAAMAGYYGYRMESQIHELGRPWWEKLAG